VIVTECKFHRLLLHGNPFVLRRIEFVNAEMHGFELLHLFLARLLKMLSMHPANGMEKKS